MQLVRLQGTVPNGAAGTMVMTCMEYLGEGDCPLLRFSV